MTLRIGTPAPIDTLVISIRLLQLAEGSPFNEPLITALQDWTIRAWKRVIDEQRFALTAPAICVPAIRAQLTSGKYGLALLASVLSAAQPAVNIRLDDSLKLLLSRYSMQDACTAES